MTRIRDCKTIAMYMALQWLCNHFAITMALQWLCNRFAMALQSALQALQCLQGDCDLFN
jgi:hypothetical protein